MHPEARSYLQRISDLRGLVAQLISGLPLEALNYLPIQPGRGQETNSLAALAAHIAGAEHFSIGEVVGGHPPTRDREAEFTTTAVDSAPLLQLLEETAAETQKVLSALTAAHLAGVRQARDRTIPVRWCILHVVDHTALHLGHMQLTYQLWAGGQSKPSPYWFERLP
jgi:uncharacterized damage-inducible protein DinB